MIQETRILNKNSSQPREGAYILYWMQAAQRIHYNHAFSLALKEAQERQLPLVVYFGLMDGFPEANLRSYTFLLEGLLEVKKALEKMHIPFVVVHNRPSEGALTLSKRAALLITDRGYLKIEKSFREEIKDLVPCPFYQVETNVVVPVDVVSQKEEYAAATIRRKIEKLLPEYLLPMGEPKATLPVYEGPWDVTPMTFDHLEDILSSLSLDASVPSVSHFFKGGRKEGLQHLETFLTQRYEDFAKRRNDPAGTFSSNLSPYLHFGQISPLEVYFKLPKENSENKRVFLDEMIIRRELAMNFVERNPQYESFSSITGFPRETLFTHEKDPRPYVYTLEELEKGLTHDPYWNAAQKEMLLTGKMHGYMRMYWGKKVMEWTESLEEAYAHLVYLNNRYSLDGRDPNGYAGIAWCFGKHDRPWKERPIFGKVRYMNDKGLARKFKIKDYVEKIQQLEEKEGLSWIK